MKNVFIRKGQKGFSLVELMIVVAIIGILAALAVPRFQSFQAKARSAEAKTNLSHGYTLQMAHHGDNDTYGTLQAVGFTIGADLAAADLLTRDVTKGRRYQYNGASGAATFTITALATGTLLGSCQSADHTVVIDHNKIIGIAAGVAAPQPIPGCQ